MIRFIGRQLRRLAALITLATVLLGAPWALYRLGMPLLPDHIPSGTETWDALTTRDTGQLFLGFLAIVGAVAWIIFAISVMVELGARILRKPAWHLPGLHVPQAAVSVLVGMLIAGTIATAATPAIAATLPTLPQPTAAAASTVSGPATSPWIAVGASPSATATQPATPMSAAVSSSTGGPTWTVRRGDTLWDIAQQTLGNPQRFGEIAALNEGHAQSNGRIFKSVDFLLPGWQLNLPVDANLPVGRDGPSAAAAANPVPESVTVQPGDTLSQIALDTLGDAHQYPALAEANDIANPDLIYPGQIIRIPAPTATEPDQGTRPATLGEPVAEQPDPEAALAADESADTPAHDQTGADTADNGATGDVTPVIDTSESTKTARAKDAHAGPGVIAEPSGPSSPAAQNAEVTGSKTADAHGPEADSTVETKSSLSRNALVLGGTTGLAAALAWAGLLVARRRLEQSRRPGQPPRPPLELEARVEKALRKHAADNRPDRINRALRAITPVLADHAAAGIVGVLIGSDTIELRPAAAAPPPAPLTGTNEAWILPLPARTDEAFDYEQLAALPALATVGTTADGRIAMVNVEQLGALHIGGDDQRSRHLVNHMIIELSQAPWIDGIHLHIAGPPPGMRSLDDDRIQPVIDLAHEAKSLAAHTTKMRKLLHDRNITEVRTDSAYADAWEPHILLAPGADMTVTGKAVDLINTLQSGPPAAGALITTGVNPGITAIVDIADDGTVTIPGIFNGGAICATGATDAELAATIGLFTPRSVDTDNPDDPNPADPEGLLDTDDAIPGSAAGKVAVSTNTAADGGLGATDRVDGFDLGAPDRLPKSPVRAQNGTDPDPHLDVEFAEWNSQALHRPKIAILGSAQVTGLGLTQDRPQARQIEMAVYLALYSQGVAVEKFANDLWPDNAQPTSGGRRVVVSRLRAWLGGDPDTGEPFIPTGENGYYMTDRLIDCELFTRLVRRSERRAKVGDARDALGDLQSSLALVRGPVLPEAGGQAYSWMAMPERMEDRTLPMVIIDAAHAATDLALAIGDVAIAESAAMTGRRVEPYSNIPLCDLIRIAQYCGDNATAATWAQTVLTVNDADVPSELPNHIQQLVSGALPPPKPRRSSSDNRP